MTGAKRYFLNGAALALSALLLRAIGVIWNAYLAKKLGAAGMGLISLTMSVYTLAVTFATSSVNFAATTMIAEATARNDKKAARGAMKACVCQCLVTGSAACFILTLAADFIGNEWLGDPGTVLSLRLLGMIYHLSRSPRRCPVILRRYARRIKTPPFRCSSRP